MLGDCSTPVSAQTQLIGKHRENHFEFTDLPECLEYVNQQYFGLWIDSWLSSLMYLHLKVFILISIHHMGPSLLLTYTGISFKNWIKWYGINGPVSALKTLPSCMTIDAHAYCMDHSQASANVQVAYSQSSPYSPWSNEVRFLPLPTTEGFSSCKERCPNSSTLKP